MSNEKSFNTAEFLVRLSQQLTSLVGPVVADLVIRLINREARIDLSEEQLNQLQVNRHLAMSARIDDEERARQRANGVNPGK